MKSIVAIRAMAWFVLVSQPLSAKHIEWELVLSGAQNTFDLIELVSDYGAAEVSDEQVDDFDALKNKLAPIRSQIRELRKAMVHSEIGAKERAKKIEQLTSLLNKTLGEIDSLKLNDERAKVLVRTVRDLKVQIALIESNASGAIISNLKQKGLISKIAKLQRQIWFLSIPHEFCTFHFSKESSLSVRIRNSTKLIRESLSEASRSLYLQEKLEKLHAAKITAEECKNMVQIKCDSEAMERHRKEHRRHYGRDYGEITHDKSTKKRLINSYLDIANQIQGLIEEIE